jgi:uncharacterized protein with R3H domain
MAIYSAVPPPPSDDAAPALEPPQTPSQQQLPPTSTTPIDIEAWTVHALQSLSISPIARGTGTPLAIPLDEAAARHQQQQDEQARRTVTIAVTDVRRDPIRRPLSRRDSLKTRDAVLKGAEGSRQRRRWENGTSLHYFYHDILLTFADRLVHVPNVQPPLPSDYAPHPTHPINHIPYHLAAFWDREPTTSGPSLRQRQADNLAAQQARRKKLQVAAGAATGFGPGLVPRDLREHARRSPAVRNWVRHLEEPVRDFARERAEDGARRRAAAADADTDVEGLDSEDEEIVFVGRRNQTATSGPGWKKATVETAGRLEKGVVFDDLGDDEGAAFKCVPLFASS